MVKWHKVNEYENEYGIQSMAFEDDKVVRGFGKIIGYNGILIGDRVKFKGIVYTVVMVSRLGHIGLSETEELPYTVTAYPSELIKLN